jgi:hypothetical protein
MDEKARVAGIQGVRKWWNIYLLCIAHCKSVANPWRDHFFAVLRGKIAVRSRISHYVCNNP